MKIYSESSVIYKETVDYTEFLVKIESSLRKNIDALEIFNSNYDANEKENIFLKYIFNEANN